MHDTSLTVVLGAGASYDCAGPGVTASINEEYRPPLTKDIFAPRFNSILERHPAVRANLDELRSKLTQGGDFEQILRDLFESAERSGNDWPFQVPLYLRELFWCVSLDFLKGSSKFNTLVRSVLESHFRPVMFLNLNYDLLLENALRDYENSGFNEYNKIEWYLDSSKKWLYVKPHGSVNFARILENCPSDSSGDYPTRLKKRPNFSSPIQVVCWNRSSGAFYRPGPHSFSGYWYPQIVVPAGKGKGFVCPEEHIDVAKQFIQNCKNFLIIGFSGRDEDIVSLLKTMPDKSHMAIVSKTDAKQIFRRMCLHQPNLKAKNLKLTFCKTGFSKFIETPAFKNFFFDLGCHVATFFGALSWRGK